VFFTKKQIIALVEKHRKLEQQFFNQELLSKPVEPKSEPNDQYAMFQGIYAQAQSADKPLERVVREPKKNDHGPIHPGELSPEAAQLYDQINSM
jgi:hypothetical protein